MLHKAWTIAITVAALAGCGGGSESPATASLVLSGTVATGLAVPNASVLAKCLAGSGTAISNADGSYKIVIPGGQLPCALEAQDLVNKLKLHTIATGTGVEAIANITPLTELVTARLAMMDPAPYFTAFGSATAKTITPAMLQNAVNDIKVAIGCVIDTSKLGDFMSTALKAATAANPGGGDDHDKLLDNLAQHVSPAQIAWVVAAVNQPGALGDLKAAIAKLLSLSTPAGLPPILLTLPSCAK